jgi:hypothetical protein
MMIDPVNTFVEVFFLPQLLALDRQKENQATYEKGCAPNH